MTKNIPFQYTTINFLIDILYQDVNPVFKSADTTRKIFIKTIFPDYMRDCPITEYNTSSNWTTASTISKIANRTENQPGNLFIKRTLALLEIKPEIIQTINENWSVEWKKNEGNLSLLHTKILEENTKSFIDSAVIGNDLSTIIAQSTCPSQILTILSLFALLGQQINSLSFDWEKLNNTHNTSDYTPKTPIIGDIWSCNNNEYILNKKIGEGAHASVFSAYDKSKEHMYALVFYTFTGTLDCALFRDFNLQQLFLYKIDHPSLCKVYGIVTDVKNQYFCIIEKYVKGTCLTPIAFSLLSITYNDFLIYTYQLLGAISHLHSYGIIHGDISLQNTIINTATTQCCLVDYSDTNFSGNLGNTATCKFSEYYSPEKNNSQHLDYRSDIYSLGVLLHKLLSRVITPCNEKIILELIMDKATNPQPEKRFQSIQEFTSAINSALGYTASLSADEVFVSFISNTNIF